MPHHRLLGRLRVGAMVWVVLMCGTPLLRAQSALPPTGAVPRVPPAVERARTLLEQGAGDDARALLDSLVGAQRAGTMELADALYWRGVLAERVADAERDWKRLVIDVPLSPRTPEAMVRLAELAAMRGRPEEAAGYYERVAREFPSGLARTKSLVWLARSAMDRRDTVKACGWWREVIGTREVEGELRLQLEGMAEGCGGGPATTAAGPATTAAGLATTAAGPVTTGGGTSTPGGASSAAGGRFSVQLAAYTVKAEAEALAARLVAKGIEARVDGTVAPFRVRVGRYAARAEAVQRLTELRAQGLSGFIAELPRGGGTR